VEFAGTLFDPSELRILESDRNHAKAVFANMLLAVWRKETTFEAFRRMEAATTELARTHPGGIGVMQIIEQGAIPPDNATKREFLRVFAALDQPVKHYSVVHEGTGFSAAIFRAVMLGIYTYVRPKFPHMAFDSLAKAVAWHVQQQTPSRQTPITEVALLGAMQALRREAVRAGTESR